MESWLARLKQKRNIMICFLYEFCGAAFVTYAYNLSYQERGQAMCNPLIRGFAYFIGWMIACSVSGAHFNPATSLAVFIYERSWSNLKTLIGYIFSQFLGAFAGIFVAYLLSRYYGAELYPNRYIINSSKNDLYFDEDGNIKYQRIIFQEIFQTFIFTLVFLIMKYRHTFANTDDIVKGIILAFTLYVVYTMDIKAGESLNPAFALAESCLMFARQHFIQDKELLGDVVWVYLLFPFLGSALASLLFILMDKHEKNLSKIMNGDD
ncbi:mip family channel protein [Stylonychia lemnae]|uniref:Mip family channel protein n=1 Tax=Stylonychia lemnae TaxID=5949 RepID=A0A078A7S0_STYLE|nr:mip family channel protein [Stylonychia lemnae]|eukprot:CDW77876.1 mip family channel protein [Stylonychia lemnae]